MCIIHPPTTTTTPSPAQTLSEKLCDEEAFAVSASAWYLQITFARQARTSPLIFTPSGTEWIKRHFLFFFLFRFQNRDDVVSRIIGRFFFLFPLEKVMCCRLSRWKVLLPWDTGNMCQFPLPVRHQMQLQQEASSGQQQQHRATHRAQAALSLLATVNRDVAPRLASEWLVWETVTYQDLSEVNCLVMLKRLQQSHSNQLLLVYLRGVH